MTIAAAIDRAGAEPRLSIEVRDTGIGISDEQMSRLFAPFAQADASVTRRFGGTGLGLAISRKIAEGLGGTVTARSMPGVGSVFRVTAATGCLDGACFSDGGQADAPRQIGPSPGETAETRDRLPPCRVLLVEDGEVNRKLISLVLRRAGAEVETAANGLLGVEAVVSAAAAGRPFELVLLDMQMPVMDGYTAAGRIRESGYAGPIVALTAHAMRGDEEKCRAAGCSGYLSKPVLPTDLIAAVRQALEVRDRPHGKPSSYVSDRAPIRCELPPGDPEVAAIVDEFVDALPETIHRLREAVAGADAGLARRLAHTLKGSAAIVGFPSLSTAAGRVEAAAASGLPVEASLLELEALADRTRPATPVEGPPESRSPRVTASSSGNID